MNNIDLSLVLIYTIGAFLTLDAYRVILMQYLTFSLGTLTRSTQLTKSSTVPNAMTQKTWLIFVPDMPRTNTAVFSIESLALDLMINDYYHFIIVQMIKFYYIW